MESNFMPAMDGPRPEARAESAPTTQPRLHRFSDGALHTALLLALIAVAVTATVQMFSVGTLMWQLDRVVVQGKAQAVPLPAAPLAQTQEPTTAQR